MSIDLRLQDQLSDYFSVVLLEMVTSFITPTANLGKIMLKNPKRSAAASKEREAI